MGQFPVGASGGGHASGHGGGSFVARKCTALRLADEGLARPLHEQDNPARMPAGLLPRLKRILFWLQEATHPRSADASGFRLYLLKCDRATI